MSKVQAYLNKHTNPPVFLISLLLVVLLLGWGVMAPANLGGVAGLIKSWLTTYFGWWYLLVVFGFLIFSLFLVFSPYGRIPTLYKYRS